MTDPTTGGASASVLAGHITAPNDDYHPRIGRQIRMGDGLHFHITADVARQWIDVLEPIAKETDA